MTTLAITGTACASPLDRLNHASPLLWSLGIAYLAAFVLMAPLPLIDDRLLNGISIWVKPAKFALSIAVHMLTLACGISLLPEKAQRSRVIFFATTVFAIMAVGEFGYIAARAALGDASHFNRATPMAEAIYSLMGAGAVVMMLSTGWIGYRLLRDAQPNAITRAAGWSFILAMVLTIVVGMTLGSMQSHWIGGDQTDANGLPVLGWSTTGGDLRVSHFIALHLMQIVPLAAWLGGARLASATAILGVAATALTYSLALMGVPVFPI